MGRAFCPNDIVEFFRARRDEGHDIACRCESQDVNHQEDDVGHFAVEQVQHRQRAGIVRGDEEHIKRLVGVAEEVVQNVQSQGDGDGDTEDGERLQNRLVGEFGSARNVHEYADDDHGAVMDHRLRVDTEICTEYVAGVNHDDRACKESVGRQIRVQRRPYLLIFNQNRREHDVHGRGAELEGEGVPFVHPRVVAGIIGVEELFVDFEHDEDGGGDTENAVHLLVGQVARLEKDERAKGDHDCKAEQVIPPVQGGEHVHFAADENEQTFEKGNIAVAE